MKITIPILIAAVGASAMAAPRLPYTFEENRGQSPAAVKFQARGEGYRLFLTEREAVLTLPIDARRERVLRMSLDGSHAPASIEGEEREGSSNYFTGGRANRDIPNYRAVRYSQVYDGIDLVYHSGEGHLEYDFVLAPHARADAIRVRFAGVPEMRITPDGALEMRLDGRTLTHRAPVAWQEAAGVRRAVPVAYVLRDDHTLGFRPGPHDPALPLTIDPVVIYSTFLGGELTEQVNAVAVDHDGNTYVTGETTSKNFPVTGSGITKVEYSVSYGFVTKIRADGNAILYSAFIGGNANTRGYAIAVDSAGNAFLGGVTGARDFPLVNPTQTTQPIFNIGYVAKLNAQGNALLFSTYLGGNHNDEVRGLVLDKSGNIHVAGRATSTQFPTVHPIQPAFGGSSDAFAAMFSAPDYRLAWSTFLGGQAAEEGNALTVDANGNTFITGLAQGPGWRRRGHIRRKSFRRMTRSRRRSMPPERISTG
jgi:hypothetical protein